MLEGMHRFSPYKALQWADRIEEILAGEFPPPAIVHVYPTNACSARCSFCIMAEEKRRYPGHINFETLTKALVQFAEFGAACFHISGGGEPSMHPNFTELLTVAKSTGCKVALSSNFQTAATRESVDVIADQVDYVRVSLNAADATGYSLAMGGASPDLFDRVCTNIAAVADRKADRKDVGVAMLVGPENANSVYDFCELANSLGVGFVHVRPEFSEDRQRNRAIRACVPTAQHLAEQARQDFPGLDVYAVSDKFRGYWSKKSYDRCHACMLNAVICADGQMQLCQDVFKPKFGNLNAQSVVEAWCSNEHAEAVAQIDISKCPRCVLENANEIIQRVFIDDEMRRFLL